MMAVDAELAVLGILLKRLAEVAPRSIPIQAPSEFRPTAGNSSSLDLPAGMIVSAFPDAHHHAKGSRRLGNPKGPPSSPVPLRSAVWTGDARDTRHTFTVRETHVRERPEPRPWFLRVCGAVRYSVFRDFARTSILFSLRRSRRMFSGNSSMMTWLVASRNEAPTPLMK